MNWHMISGFHRLAVNAAAAAIAMVGVVIGQVTAPVINSAWLVDLRTVTAVGAVVISGTWWLSRKFQSIEDKLEAADSARREMQAAIAKLIEEQENKHHR